MDRRRASARTRVVCILGPLILSAAYGCADVRVVREMPNGGVVALPMNTDCWPMYYRSRADKLMHQKCPGGYQIVREEEVWNGKEGPEGHRPYESYFGYTDPDDEMAPYLRKEYRITFHAAPAGNRRPATDTPPATGKSVSPAPAPPPPGAEGREGLPPPRPLPAIKK